MTSARTIKNPPVIEAVSEIRFESTLPSAVLFGKMYKSLASHYPDVETMPIMEMPEQIINQDQNLKYAVHYRLKNEKYILSIGPRVLGISRICNSVPYESWEEYLAVIQEVITAFKNARIVERVFRPSVKYINFYPGEGNTVESKLNFKLKTIASVYDELNINFTTKVDSSVNLAVTVGMKAQVNNPPFNKERGLIFVIEASGLNELSLKEVMPTFETLHQHVEDAFFDSSKEM